MVSNNAINLSAAGVVTYDGVSTFTGSTLTNHSLLAGGTSNAITSLGVATNGQLPIGSTGANPVLATLGSSGGTIAITNGAGSINLDVTSGGGGFMWNVVAVNTPGVARNGYIANGAGTIQITLPATSAVGDAIAVTGINNATGWQVKQNAGNTIFFGSATTTPGTGGALTSSATRDTVVLVCMTANATWNVLSSIGNITVT